MEKDEVLKKVQSKKVVVGEMENSKINKSNWIAVIIACVLAVVFMVSEGARGNPSAVFMLGAVCFTWASVFYFCQYFIAKRRFLGILIGAILETLGALIMITNYILFCIGVIG